MKAGSAPPVDDQSGYAPQSSPSARPAGGTAPSTSSTSPSSTGGDRLLNVLGAIGWTTRGLVYLVVAFIVVRVAWTGGAEPQQATKTGALNTLVDRTGGLALVSALGLGAIAYVVVRAAPAVLYPRRASWRQRGQALAAAVIYLPLAYGAFRLVRGEQLKSNLAGNEGEANGIGGWLLAQSWGRAALVVSGIALFAYAGYQVYKALSERFLRHLDLAGSSLPNAVVTRLGQAGFIARGAIAALLGIYAVRAAAAEDPTSVHSLDGALRDLVDMTFGTVLLIAIGVGLAAFAGFCWCAAACREHEDG